MFVQHYKHLQSDSKIDLKEVVNDGKTIFFDCPPVNFSTNLDDKRDSLQYY